MGAFIVGVTAVRLRKDLPELSSERLLGAVEFFASFFIPFYFFKAGLHLHAENFTWTSLGIAAALLVLMLPCASAASPCIALHRRFVLDEPWSDGARIGIAVVPTLVFTIVIAEILRKHFQLSPELFGALIVFTLVNTLLPGFLLRLPTPAYDAPELSRTSMLPPPPPVPTTSSAPTAAGSDREPDGS